MAEKKSRTEWEEKARDQMKALLGGTKLTDVLLKLQANGHKMNYSTLQMSILKGRYSHALYIEICEALGKRVEIMRDRDKDDVLRVVEFVKSKGVLIGHQMAERLIKAVGRSKMPDVLEVKGLGIEDGLPKKYTITSKELKEMLDEI